jgi:hypothetical protein
MSIKTISKFCGLGVFLLIVFAALGPENLVLRSGLGWRIDHFFGYFALTLMFCLAWRRPFLAGGTFMAIAVLLEGLQAFTPDRHADVYAALISAGGAMAAIVPADFLIRAPRQTTGWAAAREACARLLTVSRRTATPQSPALGGLVSQQLQSG